MARGDILSDQDISVKLIEGTSECIGWYDSKLSKERQTVQSYYNALLPKRQNIGSASYISTDVYDAVEGLKSQLLEVFAGGNEIARFDPDQDMGVADCLAATKYASYCIFSLNAGYQIFGDIIHDALMARVGVVKVWWDPCFDYDEQDFDGIPLEAVHILAGQDDVDSLEANHNDDRPGTYSGTLTRKTDRGQVRILNVPPEEFLIKPRAVSIKSSPLCSHRTLKTKAELKNEGYDAKKVDDLHYDDTKGLDLSPEVLARFAPVESSTALNDPIDKEMEQIMVYETYVRMQIDRRKGVRLYRIVHAYNTIFEKEEVDRSPFFPYVPLPVPHIFHGNNFAARVIPTQNARTVLTRAVLDHASMTINPRWEVVNGGLLNPREMLDNRHGGLVNVRRSGTVSALEVPNLNPFVFQILGQLSTDSEKSTGISALSQGQNKDAISKQNSQAALDQMVTLGSQRQKIAARNFAYNFFSELMIEVIRLCIANEKKATMLEVAGSQIMCSPQDWKERKTCTVSMHLGYGEADKAALDIKEAYTAMAEDQTISNMFTPQNRYNMIVDGMKLKRMVNHAAYITAPDKAKPMQADPIKTAEVAAKTKQADASMLTAQTAQSKSQWQSQIDQAKTQYENARLHLEAMTADRENDRKDTEVFDRIHVANREMALEEKMRPKELKGIVSPRP